MSKECNKCLIEKPVSEFNKARGFKDGLQYICRPCNSRVNKEYYSNKEVKVAKAKAHLARKRTFSYRNLYLRKKHQSACLGLYFDLDENTSLSGVKWAMPNISDMQSQLVAEQASLERHFGADCMGLRDLDE